MAGRQAMRINDAAMRFRGRHPENSLDCLNSVCGEPPTGAIAFEYRMVRDSGKSC
jgi:hypothetical protein